MKFIVVACKIAGRFELLVMSRVLRCYIEPGSYRIFSSHDGVIFMHNTCIMLLETLTLLSLIMVWLLQLWSFVDGFLRCLVRNSC
jgi:hypothetical protein